MTGRPLSISVFRAEWSKKREQYVPGSTPESLTTTWDELADSLGRFMPNAGGDLEKLQCPAWVPAPFSGRRCSANVGPVECLVLDYDDGTPLYAALDRWVDYERVAHTSWNNQPAAPKCRVVMPLARPVDPDAWRDVYRRVLAIDGREADPKCINPDRLYYVPAVGAGGPQVAVRRPGAWLDLAGLVERVQALREREAAERQARAAEVNRRMSSTVPRDRAEDELRARLREDPDARARAGVALGGHVVQAGEPCVRGIKCPACGRPSVWWPLYPRVSKRALCQHRNSCEWTGGIYELLRGTT